MRGECNRNYRDCKLCPDIKDCPYELSEEKDKELTKEINREIAQERGQEIEKKC